MPKVIKKIIPSGAPAYMSQFTMIMLILVCMCMIMSIMSKQQESGFMDGEGMGKVKKANALGIVIGAGVFRFGSTGMARTFADNPGDILTEAPQNAHVDLLKGEGGAGNTDLKTKDMESSKYIFSKLNGQFPPKSTSLTQQIDSEILGLGTGMSMFDFNLIVKCYCNEYTDKDLNRNLAFDRGIRIVKELNKRFGVPLTKMTCIVVQDPAMISKDAPKPVAGQPPQQAAVKSTQETAFIIKVK